MNSNVAPANWFGRLHDGRREKVRLSLLLLSVFFWVCTNAFGAIAIHWTTGWGVYDHTAGDLTGGDHFLLDSYPAVWQLVYAGPNNSIDPPNPGDAANGWVSGDDVVLAVRTIPQGGGMASEDGTTWDSYLFLLAGGNQLLPAQYRDQRHRCSRRFAGARNRDGERRDECRGHERVGMGSGAEHPALGRERLHRCQHDAHRGVRGWNDGHGHL